MMAPLKRPAAVQDVSPYKKHASSVKYDEGDAGLMQCIQDAISNSGAPQVVKDMLNNSMDHSLGIETDSRHKYQQDVVAMVESVLGDEEKKMVQELEDTKGAVEDCDIEEAAQTAIVDHVKEVASAKAEALAATQVNLANAEEVVKDKRQACNNAESELNAIKDGVNEAIHKQSKLDAAVTDVINPSKNGEGISQVLLDSFIELCTALACDAGMVQAIPSAFGKAAETLGDFDKIVIEHVEKFIKDKLAAQQGDVTKSETEMSVREAKLDAAKAELQQCIQKKESLESEVAQAGKLAKEADSDVLAAVKTLKGLGPQRKSLIATTEAATAKLETFREGALTAFNQLMEPRGATPVQHASVTED